MIFQNFPVTQILGEIIFGDLEVLKLLFFTIPGALNIVILVNFILHRCIGASKFVLEMVDLTIL